jgi:chromosome segregation ATPase
VILKPEQKNPISRYGIDKQVLLQAGIPNDTIERIYRAMFVYSVGFYELLKTSLEHIPSKFTVITALWKVFSILLEYCCRTDYRMLIQEITTNHKQEVEDLEAKYQRMFEEQANNEKLLKQNLETLQKYSETLEKERMNERSMRLKLEEEYSQNTKNHEEEVQLRLKFESKLNNMHSDYRELNTKYKRSVKDLNISLELNKKNAVEITKKDTVITEVQKEIVSQKTQITNFREKISSLQRELEIKAVQLANLEARNGKIQDELDLSAYRLQDQQKDLTEIRLKCDVLTSTNEGLMSEKAHLTTELKETRQLYKTYEAKCSEIMLELHQTNSAYQELKRNMITHDEQMRQRDDKITLLKTELEETQAKLEQLNIAHGTVNIQFSKVNEQFELTNKELQDTVQKLHITNKIRHETEVRLGEAHEKQKDALDVIKNKDHQLDSKQKEIDDLEKRNLDIERAMENLEIKKQGIERQFEMTKKQLNEKVANLNEIIGGEKETRDMWIERYDKEHKEHTIAAAQLLNEKSEHKDTMLNQKNVEIKLKNAVR